MIQVDEDSLSTNRITWSHSSDIRATAKNQNKISEMRSANYLDQCFCFFVGTCDRNKNKKAYENHKQKNPLNKKMSEAIKFCREQTSST